mmetsp:Transcript_13794/g.30047  ORF Transcript_13794/g.30047 Transcript_13794/m.30047 type:complete len:219 (-) Transcript_13794:386-1042(-)
MHLTAGYHLVGLEVRFGIGRGWLEFEVPLGRTVPIIRHSSASIIRTRDALSSSFMTLSAKVVCIPIDAIAPANVVGRICRSLEARAVRIRRLEADITIDAVVIFALLGTTAILVWPFVAVIVSLPWSCIGSLLLPTSVGMLSVQFSILIAWRRIEYWLTDNTCQTILFCLFIILCILKPTLQYPLNTILQSILKIMMPLEIFFIVVQLIFIPKHAGDG